ncbi:translation initiation factor IF-2 [Campylobacter fetus]|uniref:Translation initiation factor IF-2 n=4 Tax=Campylobacter fetus TaxID=196 RepID=A0AAX0HCI2_CAMFE|nr:translation initiation factor IF-2 [Campylobacter fetus]AGZ82297.1 translation initiation factor IF-2 [Campylobacter fetus subsp. testudinum 03-427]ALV65466.1 translation initiation factor IF-2 [Campylobacter fetus subsp. testudinum Sp3]AVK81711.1 translation initiation factor IF-2 [Campylobacter fetus subsp. testudinum]EAI4322064.1 translation initiation factor IF-2 [Campylobacter fetus]EAI4391698.1 translation initiation factor IF-2 [Campylobacter fetus]
MANIRIHEIAKELGYSNKEILEKAKELGFKVTTSSSAVTPEDAAQLYDYVQSGKKPESPEKKDIKQNTQKEAPNTQMQQKPIEQVEQNVEIKQNVDSTPVKVEPKQESLASSTLSKRRGLVIVKKKKEEVPPLQKQQSEPINKGLEAIFSSSDENLKKKKKEKKPIIAIKKESSAKMDLLSVVSFSDDIAIDDEDVVVLPDLTVKPIEVERQNTVKKQINVYKTSQNNNFSFEGGIQRNSRKKHKKVVKDKDNEDISNVDIPKEIRLYEFADKIKKSSSEVIAKLFMLGKMTTKNDFLEEDEIEILGAEFGIEVNIVDTKEDFDYVKAYEDEILEDNGVSRAPVVTIMGHVDHGKTSLLDYIRNSRVASGEAGGITQHVGAYMVEKNGKNITFIDTPGHEAFTAMRARGASVTDIVIVVVAADDGVKPQTKEAINHAKAAGVPIIIAINKMDKESANPDLVKTGLADLDILPTEWGGSYEFVPISAKTGMGIEDLLEIVLLQAEILELKANPSREAKATIIESSLQKGRGPVATAIVENGTLRVGDTIVAGVAYGKVRALQDDKGNSLKSIKPGECGVIIGLSEVPDAGETLISVKTDKEAREYAQKKYDYLRQKELSKSTKVTIDELSARIAEGELKSLPLIVKADVQGSLEAIKASLEKLKNDEIKVDIIHSGVGGITQSDITLASASANCVILGFNIRPTGDVKEKAKERSVEIKTYNVIYNLIDDVKALLSGLMSPIISEEELGQAVIRQVINVPKIGQIAGCMVTDGSINRGAKIRVIRDGVVVFEGNVSSLKRFKDDVKEVAKGYECGVGIEGYNDMREGDYIESYKEVESKVEL